jgi:hypothetical protein
VARRKRRSLWEKRLIWAKVFFTLAIILSIIIGGLTVFIALKIFDKATYHESQYYLIKSKNETVSAEPLDEEEIEIMRHHDEEFNYYNDLGTNILLLSVISVVSIVFAIGAFVACSQLEFGVGIFMGVLGAILTLNPFSLIGMIFVIRAKRAWDEELVITEGEMIKITILDQGKKEKEEDEQEKPEENKQENL